MAENSSNTAAGSHRSGVKRLIIMRHAEADWGLNDFDRPLTKRGHEQAAAAGAWLAARGYIPEQIMSSSALRTRQTRLGFRMVWGRRRLPLIWMRGCTRCLRPALLHASTAFRRMFIL